MVGTCRGLGYKGDTSSSASSGPSFTSAAFKPGLVTGSVLGNITASAGTGGPAAGRLGAVKAAFQKQYMSQV